jgi:hypothetical protein
LPTNIEGFGVSAKDLTGDGSNRLFIAKGDGTFREIGAKAAGLVRPAPDPDRPKVEFDAGVSVGDVNRDGLPNVAVAEHYASAANLGCKIPAVSLYLNRGLNSTGNPVFEDVTTKAGLPSVASRSADVNINDYDNDGWPDIAAGVAVSRTRPAVFRSLGLSNGVPRYAVPAGVGQVKGTAEPGDQSHYGLPVATADYDKDGRLDVFYDYFFSNVDGQLLLRNETGSGTRCWRSGRWATNTRSVPRRATPSATSSLLFTVSTSICRPSLGNHAASAGSPQIVRSQISSRDSSRSRSCSMRCITSSPIRPSLRSWIRVVRCARSNSLKRRW